MKYFALLVLCAVVNALEIVEYDKHKGPLVYVKKTQDTVSLVPNNNNIELAGVILTALKEGKITNVILFKIDDDVDTAAAIERCSKLMIEIEKESRLYPSLIDANKEKREAFESQLVLKYIK